LVKETRRGAYSGKAAIVEHKEIPLGPIFAVCLLLLIAIVVMIASPERRVSVISTPTPVPSPVPVYEYVPDATVVPTSVPTAAPTAIPANRLDSCAVIDKPGKYVLVQDLVVSSSGKDFSCFTIDASGVELDCRGYSIQGSNQGSAILLRKGATAESGKWNAVVRNCVATGFEYGLNVISQSNLIEGNEFNENAEGIWLWSSSGNAIRANVLHSNYNYGVTLAGGSFNNVIEANVLEGNGVGGSGGGIYENTESRPNNVYSDNRVCLNGHDLVCDAGNMIDDGGNSCGSRDSCNVECLPC